MASEIGASSCLEILHGVTVYVYLLYVERFD